MMRYKPGEAVPAGTYWNSKTWEFVTVADDGDSLPAGEGQAYYRAPLPLVLVAGPLVGLAYVIFLPFAVPVIAIYLAATRVAKTMTWLHHRAADRNAHAGR